METIVTALVGLIEFVTAPIPFLASSGILLAAFAALWAAVGVALVHEPVRLAAAWARLRATPLAVQALIWLLLLPIVAGLWVWHTAWPRVARIVVLAGIATWNLVMFLPAPA
jgi:hypothetical protein